MNKKTTIILSLSVLIIIIIGLIFFSILKPKTETSTTEENGFIGSFFPETTKENGLTIIETPTTTTQENQIEITGQPTRQLIQITDSPVVGPKFNEQSSTVYFFEKTTGYLFEVDPTGTNKKQITLTTIPKIFEVLWDENSLNTILRYASLDNNDIQTLFVTSTPTTTPESPTEIEGTFLSLNILSINLSPSEDKIFYLTNEEDKTTGILLNTNNKNKEEIFSSYLKNFLVNWPQKNIITLQTKPSAFIGGYLYKLNPNTESFTKILGNIKGLTTLFSPFDNLVLYSQSSSKNITTKLYNISEDIYSDFTHTTLPEKCLFSKNNENIIYCAVPKNIPSAYYPDDWYKGKISFNDTLWKIDLENGSTKIILDKEDFDIINIFTNTKEDYLFFENKKDSTLWSLNLTING